MSDLLLVVTCPQCGADINWREGVPTDSGLRCVAVGACTECRYEYFARVELGYVVGQGSGRGSSTKRVAAVCIACGAEFDAHYALGVRTHKPRRTCSEDCHANYKRTLATARHASPSTRTTETIPA